MGKRGKNKRVKGRRVEESKMWSGRVEKVETIIRCWCDCGGGAILW